MTKVFIYTLITAILSISCRTYNKGIVSKRELRSKKPPSVKIAQEFDKRNRKLERKLFFSGKNPEKSQEKIRMKVKKRGDKYLKKRRKGRD